MTPAQESPPANIAAAPPPWQLSGSGYIVQVEMPEAVLEHGSFIQAGTRRIGRSRVATMMFVDYADSAVGPYHELLYIPGHLQIGPRRDLSITRIYVSSWPSVVNGRANWGIPKDHCTFDVRYGEDGIDRVALSAADGSRIAELELTAFGPSLPAPGHWVPKRFRTLSQLRDGKIFSYVPSARGTMKFARVRNWQFDARYFPDLAQGKVLRAVRLPRFQMTFPIAEIQPAS